MNNRKHSVKKTSLTQKLKEQIVHYLKQKYSPEMMVKAKGVPVSISTIYYWIHHGQLGVSKASLVLSSKSES